MTNDGGDEFPRAGWSGATVREAVFSRRLKAVSRQQKPAGESRQKDENMKAESRKLKAENRRLRAELADCRATFDDVAGRLKIVAAQVDDLQTKHNTQTKALHTALGLIDRNTSNNAAAIDTIRDALTRAGIGGAE